MNIGVLFEIWRTKAFTILFLAGFLTSVARWFEVFLFSVIAWKLTGNASIAAFLIMLRLLGVAATGITFSFAGAFVEKKKIDNSKRDSIPDKIIYGFLVIILHVFLIKIIACF